MEFWVTLIGGMWLGFLLTFFVYGALVVLGNPFNWPTREDQEIAKKVQECGCGHCLGILSLGMPAAQQY